ncbi:Panacea domain-containing protein [Glutamicibacter sp. NPDC087344]|uniref:Panacea domain-containing protein n=1 Tax=Glutamicibacter sp. NPDC087344 TaxID=3363994 RepID=UPI0037F7EED5
MADFVIQRNPGLTSMKLQKLLYYIQAWHLALTNRPAFSEDSSVAYKDGPVCIPVHQARKDIATRNAPQSMPSIPPITRHIAELVLAEYEGRSGDELSALIHVESPWLEARKNLPAGAPGQEALSNESIKRFYRNNRTLGGRSAAEIAAGGFIPSRGTQTRPSTLSAALQDLPPLPAEAFGNHPFSANMQPVDDRRIRVRPLKKTTD